MGKGLAELLRYYLGPTGIPERLGAANSMFNPVDGVGQSMAASRTLFAPETTPMGRVEATGNMLSGMAGVVAPAVVASRAGVPAANALVDTMTGLNTGAKSMGRAVVDRANQTNPNAPTTLNMGVNLNGRTWFHGTPDARQIREAGGFTDAKRAVYMTDNRRVADTYADDTRAFDYQNANPEVLRLKSNPSRVVDFDAGGANFKGLDAGVVRRGFVQAGANEAEITAYLDELLKSPRAEGKIRTADVEKMLVKFGFDAADIANVRDTYMFSAKGPKSTVRMVMNPSMVSVDGLTPPVAPMVGSNGGNLFQAAPMKAPETPSFRAYHGSPHSFDKFSMDKIGTGEGAQAYGHGLYFADSEGVARGYRDTLAKARHQDPEYWADVKLPRGLSVSEYDEINMLAAEMRRRGNLPADEMTRWRELKAKQTERDAAIEAFKKENPGSMYEVQINADPETFLDWDKPLSEQPQAVRDFADGRWNQIFGRGPDASIEGEFIARAASPQSDLDGRAWLDTSPASDQAKRLREAGIPGIRYLDAGSRTAGDGSRNYVVFDDSLINIIRKYGIAGLMMGGGAAAMQPGQAQAAQ